MYVRTYVCIRFKLCVRYLRLAFLESANFTFKVKDGRSSFIRNFGTYLQTCLRRPPSGKYIFFYPERTIIWFSLHIFPPLLASSYGQLVLIWKKIGKAVPLQGFWSGPEGSRKLRFPDYMTTAQDGGKVISLTYRLSLLPGNAPVTHFC